MLTCIEYASGLGGVDEAAGNGPELIKKSLEKDKRLIWHKKITTDNSIQKKEAIVKACKELAKEVFLVRKEEKFFCVLSGDHSSAIGTWSGAKESCTNELGLIWIDAHMDLHTEKTSPSKNIHGMPLAALLGYGKSCFTNIMRVEAKLSPENLYLYGIRSYEEEEKRLLNELKVNRTYASEFSDSQGFDVLLSQAKILNESCEFFGVSLDIDAFDPRFAPGVSTPVRGGLDPKYIIKFLKELRCNYKKKFIGLEITEFNPQKDENNKTLLLVKDIINSLHCEKKYDASKNLSSIT